MRMKVSFSCQQIFLHMIIGSNVNGTFASFTLLTTIALAVPPHFESAIVDENSCYSVIKFIDFCT